MEEEAPKNSAQEPQPITAISNTSCKVVGKEQLTELHISNIGSLQSGLGITPTTWYQLLTIPSIPAVICEGKYYYNPIDIGAWIGTNEQILPSKKLFQKFRDPTKQGPKNRKYNKQVQQVINDAIEGDNSDAIGFSTSTHPDIVAAKRDHIREQIKSIKIANAKQQGVLVERYKFEQDEAQRIGLVKNHLLRFGMENAALLEGKTLAEIREHLDKRMNEIMEKLKKEIMDMEIIDNDENIALEDKDGEEKHK